MSGVMSEGLGDVGPAGQSQQADGGVADGGHDLGCCSGADLGAVFVVGDITHPVEAVLDAPVTLDPGSEVGRLCAAGVGGGDQVDHLDGLLPGPGGAAASSATSPVKPSIYCPENSSVDSRSITYSIGLRPAGPARRLMARALPVVRLERLLGAED